MFNALVHSLHTITVTVPANRPAHLATTPYQASYKPAPCGAYSAAAGSPADAVHKAATMAGVGGTWQLHQVGPRKWVAVQVAVLGALQVVQGTTLATGTVQQGKQLPAAATATWHLHGWCSTKRLAYTNTYRGKASAQHHAFAATTALQGLQNAVWQWHGRQWQGVATCVQYAPGKWLAFAL